jgi:hypothetical protein
MNAEDKENLSFQDDLNKIRGLHCVLQVEFKQLCQIIFGHQRPSTAQEWLNAHNTFSEELLQYLVHLKLRLLQVSTILSGIEDSSFDQLGQYTYMCEEGQGRQLYFENEALCKEHAMEYATSYPRVAYIWKVGGCHRLISPTPPKPAPDGTGEGEPAPDGTGEGEPAQENEPTPWRGLQDALSRMVL